MLKFLKNFQTSDLIFYDIKASRDYVFPPIAYGTRLLTMTLMFVMIPSYFQLLNRVHELFEKQIPQKIAKLPTLHLVNHRLQSSNQPIQTLGLINAMDIQWFEYHYVSGAKPSNQDGQFLLSPFALLYQFPHLDIFGLQLGDSPLYLPVYMWIFSKVDVLNGQDIIKNMEQKTSTPILLWSFLTSYLTNLLFIVIFIRTFAFVARKMVFWFMRQELTYGVACRLLSVSGVLPLILFAIISFYHPLKEDNKFFYSAIYMFNFYFGVRVISARSTNRWLSTNQS